jgi:hypothetical protein
MMRSGKAVVMVLAVVVSSAAWAGASSSSSMGGGGSRIDKINRHALKSAVLVRQLLAQNGVAGVAARK